MSIHNLDSRAIQSLMKMGGKKKLDTLIELFKEQGPARVQELLSASSLSEAQAAARVLKTSASHLGLSVLEDLCDQVLKAHQWSGGSPLAQQIQASYPLALSALLAERNRL